MATNGRLHRQLMNVISETCAEAERRQNETILVAPESELTKGKKAPDPQAAMTA